MVHLLIFSATVLSFFLSTLHTDEAKQGLVNIVQYKHNGKYYIENHKVRDGWGLSLL